MEQSKAISALAALAQETRLDVFRLLVQAGGPGMAAGNIGRILGLPAPTLSFHLSQLKNAGLVSVKRESRSLIYTADYGVMNALLGYLTENCCQGIPTNMTPTPESSLQDVVREKYGEAARRVLNVVTDSAPIILINAQADEASNGTNIAAGCCGPVNSCCGGSAFNGAVDPITSNLYVNGETSVLPEAAVLASLGCGNPTALAELKPGETVLDLGSGGGIDVLLSARRVGETGKAYGLDMTDDMLTLARRNAEEAGVTNVEFLKGKIEQIPLPAQSVDVIISNCVINLSGNKRDVFSEAFRVLKPGGRLAVSDVVVRGDVPADVRRSMELWVGCVAGALEEAEFGKLLSEAGFTQIEIEPTRVYKSEDARQFLQEAGIDVDSNLAQIDGRFMAAFVRATKPHS